MDQLTCITLWQPWASLIAQGMKQYETRSWATSHRGRLGIHAAKAKNSKAEKAAIAYFQSQGLSTIPFGSLICIVDLTACICIGEDFISKQSEFEIGAGDWSIGRYAWKLENVRVLSEPIPITGKQGLWRTVTV